MRDRVFHDFDDLEDLPDGDLVDVLQRHREPWDLDDAGAHDARHGEIVERDDPDDWDYEAEDLAL